jgi:hypothetical protein
LRAARNALEVLQGGFPSDAVNLHASAAEKSK